jgi:hypothetical protein
MMSCKGDLVSSQAFSFYPFVKSVSGYRASSTAEPIPLGGVGFSHDSRRDGGPVERRVDARRHTVDDHQGLATVPRDQAADDAPVAPGSRFIGQPAE